MKNLFAAKALLFICFLLFASQCSTDKTGVPPMATISSAKQLASDTVFIAAVRANRAVAGVLFNKLRSLGNSAARKQQAFRINQLIASSNETDNAKKLASEFGFANEGAFKNSIFKMFKARIDLEHCYSNYKKLDPKLCNDAYAMVVDKINNENYGAAKPTTICAECPFNNCDECWGGPGGTCPFCVEQPGSGGGGTTTRCITACQNIRIQSSAHAHYTLWAAIGLACPGVAWEMGTIGMCLGGPLGAGAGGTCAAFVCGALAYANYLSDVSIAENSYVTCVSGCN